MPKEKLSLLGVLRGDEPGPLGRLLHDLSGGGEGRWGERCAAAALENRAGGGRVFQNVYVPFPGGTAEVDVVLARESGLIALESKAYGGLIRGGPDSLEWVQLLGGRACPFYNPVRQNETHCRRLARALGIPRERVYSLIVFENRADLSGVTERRGETFTVCSRRGLPRALREADAGGAVFSPETLQMVWDRLEEWSRRDRRTRRRHVRQLEERMGGSVCPVCGRALVERKGPYGAFLGCSGYPGCTYTRRTPEP